MGGVGGYNFNSPGELKNGSKVYLAFPTPLKPSRESLSGTEAAAAAEMRHQELYPDKVKNMHRHPFRMSLFDSPPYLVNFSKSAAPRDQDWVGYDGGMVNEIVQHFNATLELVVPVNNDPG